MNCDSTIYSTMEYLNNAELSVQIPVFNYILHIIAHTQKKSVAKLRLLLCIFFHSKTEKAIKSFSNLFHPSALPFHHPRPTYFSLFPEPSVLAVFISYRCTSGWMLLQGGRFRELHGTRLCVHLWRESEVEEQPGMVKGKLFCNVQGSISVWEDRGRSEEL